MWFNASGYQSSITLFISMVATTWSTYPAQWYFGQAVVTSVYSDARWRNRWRNRWRARRAFWLVRRRDQSERSDTRTFSRSRPLPATRPTWRPLVPDLLHFRLWRHRRILISAETRTINVVSKTCDYIYSEYSKQISRIVRSKTDYFDFIIFQIVDYICVDHAIIPLICNMQI